MSAHLADEKTLGRDEKGQPIVAALEVDVAEDEMNLAEDVIKAEAKYTPEQQNRLRWKIDLILMPIMMFTYGLQYSDKVSLSSGVVFGLKPDTGLVGNEYAFLTIWFYLAYMLGQLPMQWVLQKVPLGKGLAVTCLLWGLCVVCLGACNNYAQLSAVRFLLGWFECAITPGFLLIVASWYKRSESTLRSCLFFSMNTCFSIIFGVAIYFIAKNAQENGGPAGWRVINYFLGALTIFDGFLLLAFLGTPKEVWWLSKEQKEMAHARIVSNATGGGEQHPWKWEQVTECFKDPQWYFAVLFNLMATIPNGALGTFQVLIFSSFGFDALGSILYGLPSSAIGCVFVILSALVVTKWPRARFIVAVVMNIVPMCVFLYVGLVDAGKWQKWACFSFVSVFAISTFMLWSIIPINTAGRTKKSFMSACIFVAYCAGNIVGSQIFLPSDAPKYLKGLTACAIVMAFNTVNMVGWYAYYRWTNAKREKAFLESGMSMEERVHLNKLAGETDMTDLQNPHFRYTC